MPRKVKMKKAGQTLNVPGMGRFSDDNITPEMYDKLVKLSPNFADSFVVEEEEEGAKPSDQNGEER